MFSLIQKKRKIFFAIFSIVILHFFCIMKISLNISIDKIMMRKSNFCVVWSLLSPPFLSTIYIYDYDDKTCRKFFLFCFHSTLQNLIVYLLYLSGILFLYLSVIIDDRSKKIFPTIELLCLMLVVSVCIKHLSNSH